MMTVKDVAKRLNVSEGAIYKAIQNGALEHHRFGAAIRVTDEQLAEFLDETRIRVEREQTPLTRFKHL